MLWNCSHSRATLPTQMGSIYGHRARLIAKGTWSHQIDIHKLDLWVVLTGPSHKATTAKAANTEAKLWWSELMKNPCSHILHSSQLKLTFLLPDVISWVLNLQWHHLRWSDCFMEDSFQKPSAHVDTGFSSCSLLRFHLMVQISNYKKKDFLTSCCPFNHIIHHLLGGGS